MTARANDQLWWLPTSHQRTLHHGLLFHVCPTSLAAVTTTRQVLDPMALNVCRYCGERLPVTPHKEKDRSAC